MLTEIRKIEQIDENEKQKIMFSLSQSAKERLLRKKNEKLHLSSLCALAILTEEQRADLEYAESGMPYFKTLNMDISISHSASFVAVVISDSKECRVGIDIEELSSIDGLHERFFTENERLAHETGTALAEIWTKKEALFKFLKSDSTPFIHLNSTTPEKYGAYFSTVTKPEYTLTLCTPIISK